MNISWGTKIAILYIGFVVMIVSLVSATMFKKVDLVADDYYHQETVFQERLNATKAGDSLEEPVKLNVLTNTVFIDLPQKFKGQGLSGNIHFYAPSNAAADYTQPLQPNETTIAIDRKKLKNIPYEVQVSWTAAGKSYYQSIPLNLQ